MPRALLLLCLFASVSCAQLRIVGECEKLADRVNPTLDTIEQQLGAAPRQPGTYKSVAALYQGLSTDLVRWQFSSARLKNAVSEYAGILAGSAKAARSYSDALRDADLRRQSTVRMSASKHRKREQLVVGRIKALCRTP